MIPHSLNLTASMAATFMRAGVGISAVPAAAQPQQLLRLYDFEGCPHCRLVREVITELDLDALIQPCPKGGRRFRREVAAMGGKAQFPYLVDPNTDVRMYESADIIRYLFKTYAQRPLPWRWRLVELQRLGSMLAALPRLGAGVRRRRQAVAAPPQPLELYSFESNPFARPVRDLLCELELPYVLRSCGRGDNTGNRRALKQRAGSLAIPYLIDANTGSEMGESADIINYLRRTYLSA